MHFTDLENSARAIFTTSSVLEEDLVRRFCLGIANVGLGVAPGVRQRALIVGHEVALLGASTLGNTGAADLLMVTEDGRWWIVEAKLKRNSECRPSFVYGNQLARYAQAIEDLKVSGLHARLEDSLYDRHGKLGRPEDLHRLFQQVRDLNDALTAWCKHCNVEDPACGAGWLISMLESQIAQRSITLAALIDKPDDSFGTWISENRADRSLALLTIEEGHPQIRCHGLALLSGLRDGSDVAIFPPFKHIPQSYKPIPTTLPRVLSDVAYGLYTSVLEKRFKEWTSGAWPNVSISEVTTAAFSIHWSGKSGREICLQVGRSNLTGGGGPGAHPLKLIVNMIWAAERVYAMGNTDAEAREAAYLEVEVLVFRLCTKGGMLVRGISRQHLVGTDDWYKVLRRKMRGDGMRRPELVAVREVDNREGYGWTDAAVSDDAQLLTEALDAAERWLGPPPYTCVARDRTQRAVPGSVR